MKKQISELKELNFYNRINEDFTLTISSLDDKELDSSVANLNYKKMVINIEQCENEFLRLIEFTNKFIDYTQTNLLIHSKKNEEIILSVNSKLYQTLKNDLQHYSYSFKYFEELGIEDDIISGEKSNFLVSIGNRNIRKNYSLIKPIYNQDTLKFEYGYRNDCIFLDINDFDIEEVIVYE